jgi:hypothetical protein
MSACDESARFSSVSASAGFFENGGARAQKFQSARAHNVASAAKYHNLRLFEFKFVILNIYTFLSNVVQYIMMNHAIKSLVDLRL